MTADLDLGSLQLQSKTSAHCVYVHSTAQFAASEEDEIDLKSLLTRPQLRQQVAHSPWVRAGTNLILSLTIHVESVSDLVGLATIEQFCSRLVHAKLWSQLRFAIPSIQTSRSANVHQIDLRLKYDPYAVEDTKRKMHKLGRDIPFHDVRPTSEVSEVLFERANFQIRATSSPRPPPSTSRPEPHPEMLDVRLSSHIAECYMPSCQLSADEETDILFDKSNADHECLIREKIAVSRIIAGDGYDENQMLFFQTGFHEDFFEPLSSNTPGMDLDHSTSQLSDSETNDFGENISTVAGLLEMAVGIAILGPRKRRRKGCKLSCPNLTWLSSVAPSIWLPGYLPAISAQFVFLPTIAHALTSVLHGRANGTSSHAGADTRSCTNTHQDGHADTGDKTPRDPRAVSKDLRQHLWQTSAAALYDMHAARPVGGDFSYAQPDDIGIQFTNDALESSQEAFICSKNENEHYNEEDLLDLVPHDELDDGCSDGEPLDLLDLGIELKSDRQEALELGPTSKFDVDTGELVLTAPHSLGIAFGDDKLLVGSDVDMLSLVDEDYLESHGEKRLDETRSSL